MDLKALKAKASAPLARLREGLDGGHPVALDLDAIRAVLALVDALDSALPSVGRASDLEVTCNECGGSGGDCPECDGIGTLPTEAGKRVLDLVTRHLVRPE